MQTPAVVFGGVRHPVDDGGRVRLSLVVDEVRPAGDVAVHALEVVDEPVDVRLVRDGVGVSKEVDLSVDVVLDESVYRRLVGRVGVDGPGGKRLLDDGDE